MGGAFQKSEHCIEGGRHASLGQSLPSTDGNTDYGFDTTHCIEKT